MLNSSKIILGAPAWLMTQHMPSLPVGQSSTSWCETPHTTSPSGVSGSLSICKGEGNLTWWLLSSPGFRSLPFCPSNPLCSASPRTSSHRCFSESRNVQGTAVCIPSGVKNLVTILVGPGFWLAESEPFNMETIRSVSCQVLGVASEILFQEHTQDSCPSCAHLDKVVAGSHFQI